MKHQALFSSKEKKVSSAAIFLSGLKETFSFSMCELWPLLAHFGPASLFKEANWKSQTLFPFL